MGGHPKMVHVFISIFNLNTLCAFDISLWQRSNYRCSSSLGSSSSSSSHITLSNSTTTPNYDSGLAKSFHSNMNDGPITIQIFRVKQSLIFLLKKMEKSKKLKKQKIIMATAKKREKRSRNKKIASKKYRKKLCWLRIRNASVMTREDPN